MTQDVHRWRPDSFLLVSDIDCVLSVIVADAFIFHGDYGLRPVILRRLLAHEVATIKARLRHSRLITEAFRWLMISPRSDFLVVDTDCGSWLTTMR